MPTFNIKIPSLCCRKFAAPGEHLLFSIGGSIGGTMPLGFCRQALPRPTGIRTRFGMANIDWPVHRKRNPVEHRLIVPMIAMLFPKRRVRNVNFCLPVPIRISPPGSIGISTSLHELEEFTVSDFELMEREGGN